MGAEINSGLPVWVMLVPVWIRWLLFVPFFCVSSKVYVISYSALHIQKMYQNGLNYLIQWNVSLDGKSYES